MPLLPKAPPRYGSLKVDALHSHPILYQSANKRPKWSIKSTSIACRAMGSHCRIQCTTDLNGAENDSRTAITHAIVVKIEHNKGFELQQSGETLSCAVSQVVVSHGNVVLWSVLHGQIMQTLEQFN